MTRRKPGTRSDARSDAVDAPCDTAIVVPCYNEAARLRAGDFADFVEASTWSQFVFVDDGSTDATGEALHDMARRLAPRAVVVDLRPNQGKAAAVRAGMLRAFTTKVRYAGYWDADLATPLREIPRFRALLREQVDVDLVMGSRVQMLGREITRSPARHYAGRVFATLASATLDLPVYDTQCGAKLFRVSARTRALFEEPFLTRWLFDVEILARWIAARDEDGVNPSPRVVELPLERWNDVAGSRVRATDFLKSILQLARIHRRYRARGPSTAGAKRGEG